MPLTVRIFMSRYHQQISLSAATQPVRAGTIVEYGCRTEGSKPNANIEWFLDDQRIIVTLRTSSTVSNSVDNELPIQKTESYQWLPTSFNNCIVNDDNIVNGNGQMVNRITTSSSSSEVLLSNDNSNWQLPINEQINYPNDLLSQQQRQTHRRQCKFLSIIETHKTNSTLSIIRFIPNFSDNNRILSCQASNPFIAMADNNNNNFIANNSFSGRNFNNNNNNNPNKSNNRITDKITLNIQCMYDDNDVSVYSSGMKIFFYLSNNNNNISYIQYIYILIGNFFICLKCNNIIIK